MAFSEKLKKEVRMKSDVRCAVCHKPFVEIHHIVPQADGGDDTFLNAVALCAYCHDIYGANPSKRIQLRELRDSWYKIVEASKAERYTVCEKITLVEKKEESSEPQVVIYHVVYEDEDFNDAAKTLIKLTSDAQKRNPNQKRVLYLDIDGHRIEDGTFDADMWELQFNFILQNLINYYTEVNLPICTRKNKYKQINEDIEDEIKIYDNDNIPEHLKKLEGSLFLEKSNNEAYKKYMKEINI